MALNRLPKIKNDIQDAIQNVQWPFYDFVRHLDPKVAYQFIVLFKLPQRLIEYLSSIEKDEQNGILAKYISKFDVEDKTALGYSVILSYGVRTIEGVREDFNTIQDTILNQNIYMVTNVNYPQTINVTFRDFQFLPILRILRAWFQLATDPIRRTQGKKSDYVGQIFRIELSHTLPDLATNYVVSGNTATDNIIARLFENSSNNDLIQSDLVERVVIFDSVFPTRIPDDYELTVEGTDMINYTIPFTFERKFENIELQSYNITELNEMFKIILSEQIDNIISPTQAK